MSDVFPVTEDDILHPPANMLAAHAVITKIYPHGPLDPKPHDGFTLDLKIISLAQGQVPADTITVEYGPCHNLPGREGDTIPVLALQSPEGHFYAPQFWAHAPAEK